MRLGFVLFAAEMVRASIAWTQILPPLADWMFCDYVADFAPQIARNKIRMVPFLRLDEFDYFDVARRRFLKRTAQEIYTRNPEALRRTLGNLADTYGKECRDAFDQS